MNRLLLFTGLFAFYGFLIIQTLAQNITTEIVTGNVSESTTSGSSSSTTTTTALPNTTTASTATTTTTAATTTQTTPKPTTLPTLAPPTTPIPPEAPKNAWNVSSNGSICILAEFALTVRIGYNSTVKPDYFTTGFNIPADASVDTIKSYCANNTQALSLDFSIVHQTNGNITFTFTKNKDSVYVEKVKISYQLTENSFPDYVNKSVYGEYISAESVNLTLFSVDLSHAYGCNSETSVELENIKNYETISGAVLKITKAKVQAFSKTDTFGAVSQCKDDGTEVSDVVPIAVGASLAGLVVIVLIAYFVGRRRSRRLAYQSV